MQKMGLYVESLSCCRRHFSTPHPQDWGREPEHREREHRDSVMGARMLTSSYSSQKPPHNPGCYWTLLRVSSWTERSKVEEKDRDLI